MILLLLGCFTTSPAAGDTCAVLGPFTAVSPLALPAACVDPDDGAPPVHITSAEQAQAVHSCTPELDWASESLWRTETLTGSVVEGVGQQNGEPVLVISDPCPVIGGDMPETFVGHVRAPKAVGRLVSCRRSACP